MTTIGLIRHGITDWNDLGRAQGITDIPMNESGRNQAAAVGERLMEEAGWDLIVSSDLSRAVETAEIIGRKIGMPVHDLDRRIREMDCGEIEGTTEVERVEKWGSSWRKRNLGMENFIDVGRRGKEFLEWLVREHSGRRVLVVSHGALIGLTLQQLLPERFPTTQIDHTSLTVLNHADGVWECSLYNCTTHLVGGACARHNLG